MIFPVIKNLSNLLCNIPRKKPESNLNNFFCKIAFSMAHKIIYNVVIFITSKQNNYRCRLRGIDNYVVCKVMYT